MFPSFSHPPHSFSKSRLLPPSLHYQQSPTLQRSYTSERLDYVYTPEMFEKMVRDEKVQHKAQTIGTGMLARMLKDNNLDLARPMLLKHLQLIYPTYKVYVGKSREIYTIDNLVDDAIAKKSLNTIAKGKIKKSKKRKSKKRKSKKRKSKKRKSKSKRRKMSVRIKI